jgi:tight adherence protein B
MLGASLLLTAVAVALLVGEPMGVRRRSPLAAAAVPSEPCGRHGVQRTRRSAVLLVTAAATLWVLSSEVSGTQLAVVVIAAGSALTVARMVLTSRRAEEASRRRRSVVDFCEALVGELRAGQPVQAALERSAPVWPEVAPVVATARMDGDLPAALRRLARSPGAEALGHLAAAWQLCAMTGAGLTTAASLVLESARTDAAALRQVQGEVSSARATARLVAALPVIVLSAGAGLGARPWAFLVGHPAGVACLGGGVALVLSGLAWIDRIAFTATSSDG